VTAAVAALAVAALPEFDRTERDDLSPGDLAVIRQMLATLPCRPAIVLFRYSAGGNVNAEPVYNIDTLHLDDADVIRAHDLPGEASRKLLEYYAKCQPQRHVYRIQRDAGLGAPTLVDLGPVTSVSQAAGESL
jgi:hypothetical protein